ncbi:hypothetical protein [Escherichia phage vB_EcoM_APEC]|jgi:hypothetical protein|nr:hypothetical protein [Escherichia phage vB_EcoM_APEC]
MPKYDWSNVPDEVKWIATDSDGWISMHTIKPEPVLNINWIDSSEEGYLVLIKGSPFNGDWKESLEERPGV